MVNHDVVVNGVNLAGATQSRPVLLQMNREDFPNAFLSDLANTPPPAPVAMRGGAATKADPTDRRVGLADRDGRDFHVGDQRHGGFPAGLSPLIVSAGAAAPHLGKQLAKLGPKGRERDGAGRGSARSACRTVAWMHLSDSQLPHPSRPIADRVASAIKTREIHERIRERFAVSNPLCSANYLVFSI